MRPGEHTVGARLRLGMVTVTRLPLPGQSARSAAAVSGGCPGTTKGRGLTSTVPTGSVSGMRIVLMGAPGSGKGTQSQRLVQRFGIPQISTGDLLRSAVARGTDYGRRAKGAMESGPLVVDEIVLGIIRERLGEADAAHGFILDGFPRNLAQAQALQSMLAGIGAALDAVVLFEVDYAEIIKR